MTSINSEQSILDLLDLKAEEETLVLIKKNTFILKIINEIWKSLDNNSKPIQEFDLEANYEDLLKLFDYFYSLCDIKEASPDKYIALYFISTMLTKINNLDDNCQKIINQVMEVIIQNDYLKDKDKKTKLMFDLINDFKNILNEEMNKYLENFIKLFDIDIATLFELFIHFLNFMESNNEDIIYFTFKVLTKKYKELIISSTILDSREIKKSISISSLNELLQQKLNDEQKIIVFENSHFLIRDLKEKELENCINADFLQKIKNHKYDNISIKNYSETDKDNTNNTSKLEEIPFENIDINSLNPIDKSIYKKIKEIDKRVNYLRRDNLQLRFKVNIYKDIIKLKTIIHYLDKLPSENKFRELKEFLLSIYSYLQKENCLAFIIKEKISSLEEIFKLVEKKQKKTFPYAKKLLNDLLLDGAFK